MTNQIQNPYSQPQFQQPPMPRMMPPMLPQGNMRQRVANPMGRMYNLFPQWLTQYGVAVYILALLVSSLMYSSYSLPWYHMLSGIVAVVVFFVYGHSLIEQTSEKRIHKTKAFEKQMFRISFIIRIVWTILIYTIFMQAYGDAFGFENGDAVLYDDLGKDFAYGFRNNKFWETWRNLNLSLDVSDLGYATYVGFIYWIVGNEAGLIAVRLLKCILSAITVLLIYRLALRNFGDQVARVAAIFVALWPNFWYECGTHLKEVEMVFLSVLFVGQADQMLRSRQFTVWKVVPLLLIASILLTFRTPLALVAFLSLIFSVVMSSSRVVNWGKRIIVGGLSILLIVGTLGDFIQNKSSEFIRTAQADEQKSNMEWRSRRVNGNAFAKYAGKSVFAPLIFTIPFPSFVRPYDGQDEQQMRNGGNLVKNIMSFFTVFAIVALLITGKWREHLVPFSFMLGYLVVLAFSTFAQSERFHQPAMPFEFMFAAYGLSIAVTKPKYKRWFMYWCGVMFVACVAWSWFKMAGRGL